MQISDECLLTPAIIWSLQADPTPVPSLLARKVHPRGEDQDAVSAKHQRKTQSKPLPTSTQKYLWSFNLKSRKIPVYN